MAIFGRKRHPQDPGISPFRAGLIALVTIGLLAYFGFTKANPFANPFEVKAVFGNSNNLKPKSPVRIAGVEVGKVKKVEPITKGEGAARVTMELKDKALPLHEDAQLKVRSRIFLEGNFFIDIQPGSPSAPAVEDGHQFGVAQTAAPVQLGQVLETLQSDTREDLQVFLREYSKGLEGKGAAGFNQSIKYWEEAYRNASLANDATLGEEPDDDLQRVVKSQQRVFAALSADEQSLKDLVTNFNTTAAAFAREDVALEATIPALRDTLRVAQPALRSLNDSLPSVRAFARDALPGTRTSDEALKASIPFIAQLRRLVSKRELRGTAAVLRRYIPDFVDLNDQTIKVSEEGRALSACTNKVLVPFNQSRIPAPHESGRNDQQQVRFQLQRGFPGLSGESRLTDGNTPYFHGSATPPPINVRPAPPTVVDQPPARRPDVPCETQQPPNLNAPGGPITAFSSNARSQQKTKTREMEATERRVLAQDRRERRWAEQQEEKKKEARR